jgi:hypothetical protein
MRSSIGQGERRNRASAARRERAEWRRRWRSVPVADQRLIRAALRRGEAVDDPRLAALAAEAAERGLRGLGVDGLGPTWMRGAISAVQALLAALILTLGLIDGDALAILFGGGLLALAAADLAMQRVVRRRLERARAANGELAGQPRYPAETT